MMNLHSFHPIPDLPFLDNEAEESGTKLQVPGYRQLNAYSCGAVSAYSVIKTFHPEVSYQKVYEECRPSKDEGAGLPKLVRTLRRNGVGVSVQWDLTFRGIVKAVESGFPIIAGVCRNGPGSDHWCVITGVGTKPNRVFTCNQVNVLALSGREEFTWPEWQAIWDEYRMGLVCWGR